ncbi:hypothetical protein AB6A40_004733 [Gnathostoma spinigerum]|uniref:Protein kinase domain-containing protein n=1 Tax=Gnathostoma spinigerum TaxID=75299 RepID=A0ABD6EIP1_9BILA
MTTIVQRHSDTLSLSTSPSIEKGRPSHLYFSSNELDFVAYDANEEPVVNENSPGVPEMDTELTHRFLSPRLSTSPSRSARISAESTPNGLQGTEVSLRYAPGPTSCVYLIRALKKLYSKDDFDIMESLGEGFFGDVFKVKHKGSGEVMVLKIGKEHGKQSRPSVKTSVMKEVKLLNQLASHPNILGFRGVCVDVTPAEGLWNLHILVDYCDCGSLSRLICNNQLAFPWRLRYSLARDIACAMLHVHLNNVMHRDLTSMNVLLQSASCGELKAVVADFGLSCRIPSKNEKLAQVGTPYWMAPECLKEEYYDEKADIFSFGIILCQMIARIDADPEAGLYRTNSFGLDYIRFAAHCPSDTSLGLLKLAFQCCLMNPAKRPPFVNIYDRLNDFFVMKWRHSDSGEHCMDERLNDSRLNRSLSDAAVGASPSYYPELMDTTEAKTYSTPRKLNINSRSSLMVSDVPCIFIDESCYEKSIKINRMEELARSVAVEDPRYKEPSKVENPFLIHEVYSTVRKLPLPEFVSIRKGDCNGQRIAKNRRPLNEVNGDNSYSNENIQWSEHLKRIGTELANEFTLKSDYKQVDVQQGVKLKHEKEDSRRSSSVPCFSISHPKSCVHVEDFVDPSVPSSSTIHERSLRPVFECSECGKKMNQKRDVRKIRQKDKRRNSSSVVGLPVQLTEGISSGDFVRSVSIDDSVFLHATLPVSKSAGQVGQTLDVKGSNVVRKVRPDGASWKTSQTGPPSVMFDTTVKSPSQTDSRFVQRISSAHLVCSASRSVICGDNIDFRKSLPRTSESNRGSQRSQDKCVLL